jgi:Zn-dependent protease with chaperone function
MTGGTVNHDQLSLTYIIGAILTYFIIVNLPSVQIVIACLRQPKKFVRLMNDSRLLDVGITKNINFGLRVAILDSDKLFGRMFSIPLFPIVCISKGLYKKFSKSEVRYVVMHEFGHHIYYHSLKMACAQIALVAFLATCFVLGRNLGQNLFLLFPIVILLLFPYVALIRIFEYEADYYALRSTGNPRAMISATRKFRNQALRNNIFSDWISDFINMRIPYSKRIQAARRFKGYDTFPSGLNS